MQKSNVSSIVREDLWAILKASWEQLGLVSVLIWVLLFLLNAFLGVWLYAGQFSDTLKDKVGMYFYIKDIPGQESETYREIMSITDELKAWWLETMFSSKDDALSFLEKKIPNVIGNFEKYGIDNPLPATLYVMFRNENEYESLKTVILKHKDIILNIKDIDPGKSLQQQENRVLTIINFTNFLQVLSYCIIVLLGIIILTFVAFLLRIVFDKFADDLKVKKILWAASQQVTKWFVWLSFEVILWAFAICLVLLLITWTIVSIYLKKLFGISIFDAIGSVWLLCLIYLIQIIIVTWLSVLFSYFYVGVLNRRN